MKSVRPLINSLAANKWNAILGRPVLLYVSLGLLGSLAIAYATPWGPWAFSDGTGYIVSARNLLAGIGLGLVQPSGQFQPLTSHPPLYPLMLSALGRAGIDLISAARWIDIVAFGLLTFLGARLFQRLTGSKWLAAGLALWLLSSPPLVDTYTSVFAEPLFLTTGLTSSFLVTEYTLSGRRPKLLGGAFLSALALLSRYPAIAWVAASVAAIAVFGTRRAMIRIVDAAAFTGVAFAPVVVSVLLTTSQPGAEPARSVQKTIDIAAELPTLGKSLASVLWFWRPTRIPGLEISKILQLIGFGLLALGIAAALLAVAKRIRVGTEFSSFDKASWRLASVLLISAIAHVVFLSVVFLVSYPTPDINSRTVLPVLPMLMVSTLAVAAIFLRIWHRFRWLSFVTFGIILSATTGFWLTSWQQIQSMHENGGGYTSRDWKASQTLKAVADLPEHIPLISNEPEAVLLYLNRYPHYIAEIYLSASVDPALPFGEDTAEDHRLFREEGAALVLFDTVHAQLARLYGDQSEQRLAKLTEGLYKSFDGDDGAIYFATPPPQ